MECSKCGRSLHDGNAWLARVNAKGQPGVWECRPNCDADLPNDVAVQWAVEGEPPALTEKEEG